jgi:protein TonB
VPHVIPHHVKKHPVAPPPVPPSEEGTAKPVPETEAPSTAPAAASSGSASNSGSTSSVGGTGTGSGSGIVGNDNSGARAIYRPIPEIPDDLREQAMVAVAVAHFTVGYDGHVEVTLTQATMNPELNALLLDTLKQWKFAPATKNGVAIASEFDIRIPVTVQ